MCQQKTVRAAYHTVCQVHISMDRTDRMPVSTSIVTSPSLQISLLIPFLMMMRHTLLSTALRPGPQGLRVVPRVQGHSLLQKVRLHTLAFDVDFILGAL